ncbi:MAG: TMEM175 family protein [Flavobacterium sp.]
MQHHDNNEITTSEIKKEFQLERMILFSDAVFAIVITLMAIEIRVPETEGKLVIDELPKVLLHLLPVIFAYIVSFIFIGAIWYQHLRIFSLLKDYDKGLVIRNLLLLFFIGLFPFSASLITRAKGAMIAFFMYMGIIMLCVTAQYLLYHYIVVKRPVLRVDADIQEHLIELRKRKISLIGFASASILITITYILIPQPEMKSMSVLWMAFFPIVYRILTKKKK